MWMIVGLGNPGIVYKHSRHNIGFMVVDALSKEFCIDIHRLEKGSMTGSDGRRVILAKPMTFMNTSGESILKLSSYYKIPWNRIIVVHDDMDTSFGSVKVVPGGGHRGHNGMRSVLSHVKNIVCVRIGIGRPPTKSAIVDYVLGDFEENIDDIIKNSIENIKQILN